MIFSRKYEIPINLTPNSKLRENVIEIRDKVEFRGILLILPGQTKETRPLRSQIIQDSDRESATTTIIIRKILLQFADYMNKLKIKISERFQWPEWVTSTKDCFDFVCSNDKFNQEETLGKLLNLLKTPITEEKKIVIMEQYIGVRYCANEYLKGTPNTCAEELWYYLFTTEEVYKGREDIFQVAVQFLVRSFNECIVESYFSAIVEVHGNLSRPRLSAETASMITFIQRNGPDPI